MFYSVKDCNIYYEVIGSGMPVVSMHGWSPDHRLMKGCMEPVFQGLETPYQRIYFDLPGMGKTKAVPWINGSDDMLEVVLQFIDGVIPNQPFLITGESYGGYLARGVLNKRIRNVAGMLLICPVANEETRVQNCPPIRYIERDEAFLQTLTEEERRGFMSLNVVLNKRVYDRYIDEIDVAVKQADFDFLNHHLSRKVPFSFDVDKHAEPYDKPVLMMTGRQDCAVGYQDLWKIIEAYPRASFVLLDKAGHNLQIEQDILFTQLVREWLKRVETYKNS